MFVFDREGFLASVAKTFRRKWRQLRRKWRKQRTWRTAWRGCAPNSLTCIANSLWSYLYLVKFKTYMVCLKEVDSSVGRHQRVREKLSAFKFVRNHVLLPQAAVTNMNFAENKGAMSDNSSLLPWSRSQTRSLSCLRVYCGQVISIIRSLRREEINGF